MGVMGGMGGMGNQIEEDSTRISSKRFFSIKESRSVRPPSTIRDVMPCSLNSRCMFCSKGTAGSSMIGSLFHILSESGSRDDRKMTGRGECPGHRRVVSDGLSLSKVLVPTIMASTMARCPCISTMPTGPEIRIGRYSGIALPGV